ncbi:single-stranded DNA-binding protein [Nocardiopsis mangrovi]|uniref:Single-stranded DNA-binding protein n=1 Tax=Nocardiopsis mangrovi TaxID=1179818 RepID=A0ABV9E7Q4_9ACTN
MDQPIVTVVGRLTHDPELRILGDGTPLCGFTVATAPRFFERTTGSWRDHRTVVLRCSAWRRHAANIAVTLARGMRVIVTGELRRRRYTDPRGRVRAVTDLRVHDAAPALRWATARVDRQEPGEDPPLAIPRPRGTDPWGRCSGRRSASASASTGDPPF